VADIPGRFELPHFDDAYDGPKMRDLVGRLTAFLSGLRPNGTLIVGGGRAITKFFGATVTWDPANVANGSQVTTTVTVTGVKLASYNIAMAGFNKDLQGMRLTAYVSADNTATVVLRNDTGGAINLAEGSLTVGVWRFG